MKLIETHCHIYLDQFKEDLQSVIERATNEGVEKFYLPAIDSSVIDNMLQLEELYPGKCIAMIGLHPCSVNENVKHELNIVESWLNTRKFPAIGEIGLDFYWDTTFAKEQLHAFNTQMEWALHFKLPIVIHTRNAMKETIEAVRPFAARGLKGIFHCFGDSLETAMQIMEMDFLMGIGGVVTYKKSGLDEVLKEVPLNNIVLETDSPYLTPVPFRGKRNEPAYLKYIVKRIAEIKQISEEEVAAITTANAEKIFVY